MMQASKVKLYNEIKGLLESRKILNTSNENTATVLGSVAFIIENYKEGGSELLEIFSKLSKKEIINKVNEIIKGFKSENIVDFTIYSENFFSLIPYKYFPDWFLDFEHLQRKI